MSQSPSSVAVRNVYSCAVYSHFVSVEGMSKKLFVVYVYVSLYFYSY